MKLKILWLILFLCVLVFPKDLTAQNDGTPDDGPMTILLKAGPPPSGAVSVSIDDVEAGEDEGSFRFTLSLSEISEGLVHVNYRILDETALAGSDYEASDGAIVIQPGNDSAELLVTVIDDEFHEEKESFVVELIEADNASISKGRGVGTILDNDALPLLSIGDVTAEEKNQKMSFTVTLSSPSLSEVRVDFVTEDGTASAGTDYKAKSGTLTIPAGENSATIDIAITMDETVKEGDESFFVVLSNPNNAELEKGRGTGTIQNTHISFVGLRKAIGLQVPEPSTYALFLIGLLGIGAVAKRRK